MINRRRLVTQAKARDRAFDQTPRFAGIQVRNLDHRRADQIAAPRFVDLLGAMAAGEEQIYLRVMLAEIAQKPQHPLIQPTIVNGMTKRFKLV